MANTSLGRSLMGAWQPLINGGNSLPDLSPKGGKTGMLTNFPNNPFLRTPLGWGLSYDGTNDYVDIGNVTSFNKDTPFSVEAWFRSDLDSTARGLIGKDEAAITQGWHVRMLSTNKIRFILASSNADSVYSDTVATLADTAAWNHIVGTYNGNSASSGIKTYLNGLLDANQQSGGTLGTITTTRPLTLGYANWTGGTGYFKGDIAIIRIYNRALTYREVRDLYANPLLPYTAVSLLTISKKTAQAFTQQLTETLSLSDSAIKGPQKLLSEILTMVDTINEATAKILLENLGLTDEIIRTRLITLTESLGLADTVHEQTAKVLIETLSASDIIRFLTAISLEETLSMTDSVQRSGSKKLSELLQLVDVNKIIKHKHRFLGIIYPEKNN